MYSMRYSVTDDKTKVDSFFTWSEAIDYVLNCAKTHKHYVGYSRKFQVEPYGLVLMRKQSDVWVIPYQALRIELES